MYLLYAGAAFACKASDADGQQLVPGTAVTYITLTALMLGMGGLARCSWA